MNDPYRHDEVAALKRRVAELEAELEVYQNLPGSEWARTAWLALRQAQQESAAVDELQLWAAAIERDRRKQRREERSTRQEQRRVARRRREGWALWALLMLAFFVLALVGGYPW